MDEQYLSDRNISSKSDDWLAKLDINLWRRKEFIFKSDKSALLVIDMQSFFLDEKSHAFIPAAKVIVPNVNSMIGMYRALSLPVVYTYHALEENEDPGLMGRWWGDIPKVNDPLSGIHSSIDWKKEDVTIRKCRYSAFIETVLDQTLKDLDIDTLVITGVKTHLCCESTARDAFMRDYEVYFVIDATASNNEDLHFSSVRALADGFAMPVKTNFILKNRRK